MRICVQTILQNYEKQKLCNAFEPYIKQLHLTFTNF